MTNPEHELAVAEQLLEGSDALGALEHTLLAQQKLAATSDPSPVLLGHLAGRLIDCGADLERPELVREGLAILESRFDELKSEIQEASLHYNIGNARKSLYDLDGARAQQGFNPSAIAALGEAKNAYWRAFRLSRGSDPQHLVNLANCLDQSCRVVEALRYYDLALSVAPGFPMAHMNRGIALQTLNQISGVYTISLLIEALRSFRGAVAGGLPPHLREFARHQLVLTERSLAELDWSEEKAKDYDEQHQLEADAHDPYWQFCLDNFLALSEHALYCRCAGSRRDDLSIPKSSGPIAGEFVARLELLLNRMKSEFCLARALYYQAVKTPGHWDTRPFEGTFSELQEREAIGLSPEFLRTSFRLCFGILDRIAQGLSELFELAAPEEALYFESFWRPVNQRNKGEERWTKINQQNNWGLVALYSIATDLNAKAGEWGFFKKHRNSLEHGLLVLVDESGVVPALARPERILLEQVPLVTFAEHALHMLQLTASAIFSFVFCVRAEGVRNLGEGPAIQLTMEKKEIGKD
ncbi:MAG: LA2681 family HEPN domain-containing protein [Thermoanaerobaculia bacterium]